MIIALTGAAGSGKDAVAGILCSHYGFVPCKMASPIYEALEVITGVSRDDLMARETKEKPIPWIGKSPRELLQTLGTEWGRNLVSEDIWVNSARMRIREAVQLGFSVVISDVRFKNEVEWVRGDGGAVWHVERPNIGSDGCTSQAATHSSERQLSKDDADLVINNTGSLADLPSVVHKALEHRDYTCV